MAHPFKLFATANSLELGKKVADELHTSLGKLYSTQFSDGEVYSRFDESIRGETVVLLAQANLPYHHLFELFITIDAARRASAKEIIVIIPYLAHSRQERKDDSRSSISSRLIADFLEHSGADRMITVDMHSTSIEGFYKIPIDHLQMAPVFLQNIKEHFDPSHLALCSPDFGGLKRIRAYKQILDCDLVVINKERLKPNQVNTMEIIGHPEGKDVIIIDDMIDTGGTLCKAAEILMDQGARSVTAYCTHGVLSGKASEKIQQSSIKELVISDSIPHLELPGKIRIVSCKKVIASAIEKLMQNKSIKALNTL